MDDFFNFKKFFFIVFIVIGGLVYIRTHYTFDDALKFAKGHPELSLSPKIEYYVGAAYFMRDDFNEAAVAYDQLLTGHPTCQYAPKSLFRLGASYQRTNRYEQAREAYLKYMEEYPEGPHFELVRKRYEYVKFK